MPVRFVALALQSMAGDGAARFYCGGGFTCGVQCGVTLARLSPGHGSRNP